MTNMIKNGTKTIDSRDVAKMMGREHKEILKMIEGQKRANGTDKHTGILPTIAESGQVDSHDYFIESSYKVEGNKRSYPCFRITKKGCEIIANKLNGKNGILFTQTYVDRFNEMEQVINQPQPQPQPQYMLPRNYVEALEALLISEKEKQVMLPKAQKYDEFLDADGLSTMTTVGKHFLGGMTAFKVAQFLQEKEVLYKVKVDNCYVPRQGYEKYFKRVRYSREDFVNGGMINQWSLKFNNQGIDFVVDLYKKSFSLV